MLLRVKAEAPWHQREHYHRNRHRKENNIEVASWRM
jgi:hypothetical protein